MTALIAAPCAGGLLVAADHSVQVFDESGAVRPAGQRRKLHVTDAGVVVALAGQAGTADVDILTELEQLEGDPPAVRARLDRLLTTHAEGLRRAAAAGFTPPGHVEAAVTTVLVAHAEPGAGASFTLISVPARPAPVVFVTSRPEDPPFVLAPAPLLDGLREDVSGIVGAAALPSAVACLAAAFPRAALPDRGVWVSPSFDWAHLRAGHPAETGTWPTDDHRLRVPRH